MSRRFVFVTYMIFYLIVFGFFFEVCAGTWQEFQTTSKIQMVYSNTGYPSDGIISLHRIQQNTALVEVDPFSVTQRVHIGTVISLPQSSWFSFMNIGTSKSLYTGTIQVLKITPQSIVVFEKLRTSHSQIGFQIVLSLLVGFPLSVALSLSFLRLFKKLKNKKNVMINK